MGTNYQRGSAIERRLVNLYRDNGWTAVRTAGSHGAFDVLAMTAGQIHLVQLKAQNGAKATGYDDDIKRLESVRAPIEVIRLFMVWRNRKGWILVKQVGAQRSELPTWFPRPLSKSVKADTSAS